MVEDRRIPRSTISQMVAAIDSAATIREAELAESGHLSVYHLTVDSPPGTHNWVLKASPNGDHRGITTEARLLSMLATHTSLPVPAVIGAVDDHDTLPAPFFLMESAGGTKVPKRDIGQLSDEVIEHLAYQSGTYLARLHRVNGPCGYGRIDVEESQPVSGARPPADVDQFTITDLQGASAVSPDAWPTVIETWAEHTLELHEATQFGDLTTEIRPVVRDYIDSLSGPFHPVIGRIDHGLHNLLLDAETGDITCMIDWGFTLSVPAAYDLACVEANLSLGPWSILPSTPNRRPLIRDTLLTAYRDAGRSTVVDQFRAHHSIYELLALLRAMNHLSMAMPDATEAQLETAAEEYRKVITKFV